MHWADVNDVRNFSNDPSALLNILYILKSICATGNFGPHLCALAQAEQKSAAHLQSTALYSTFVASIIRLTVRL